MRVSRKLFVPLAALLAALSRAQAQDPAPEFGIRFDAPAVVAAPEGGVRRVEATVLLEALSAEARAPGAQGWNLFAFAAGCDVVAATTAGTAAEDAEFRSTHVTFCRCPDGTTGALSGIALSLTGATTLPLDSPQPILRITLEGALGEEGACSECVLGIVADDRCNACHFGQPVTTRITSGGESWPPEVMPSVLRFCPPSFRRGDCNDDAAVDIADAIFTLNALFIDGADGAIPGCDDACDANDDGAVNISDPIASLGVLFLGEGAIPLPGAFDCGVDPTADALGCERTGRCPLEP